MCLYIYIWNYLLGNCYFQVIWSDFCIPTYFKRKLTLPSTISMRFVNEFHNMQSIFYLGKKMKGKHK